PASFTLISTFPYTIPPLTWTEYTYNLSAYNNQNVYIAIQCVSADEFVFMLDDVEVLSDVAIAIESNVNTPTAGQNILSGSGTAAFMDQTTRDIAARVTVNDASSYGCTSAAVTRAGSSALQYGSSVNVLDYAMSKQFTITPASVVSGNATITFYFTEAEIAGWEAFTGNNRSLLYVARDGVSREVQPLTIGSFGTGVTLTATFTGGIQGVYSFARQQSLPTDNFEFNEIGLFPNPNNGTFNIQFTPSSEKTNVVIFDVRGRVIFDQQYQNNGLFNESIQLDNVESGIYLVKIQDGSRKITKKIIVE
ncbi:T9SS type A sorting domain-containing protein, partial [Flavobacterium sp. LMO9]